MGHINVLFYDKNEKDAADFKRKQQEYLQQRGSDSTRVIHTASSLAEVEARLQENKYLIVAIFDAYEGNIYDPHALAAAKLVQTHSRPQEGQDFHQRRILLLRDEQDLTEAVAEAVTEGVVPLFKRNGNVATRLEEIMNGAEFYGFQLVGR